MRVDFPTQFCLESISNKSNYSGSEEVFFKVNAYDFSVDYNSIDKSDILNVRKCLMVKNNLKWCLGLFKKCLSHY